MKIMDTLVLGLFVSQFSFAQSSVQDELNQELDQLYSQQNRGAAIPVSGNAEVVNVPEAGRMSGLPASNSNQSPIYVIQQSQPSVQKQPTTVIESSPLKKSRADQMRESRQEVEMNTETQIVEKLEQSRIDDEKRRADVLFGERFDKLNNKEAASSPQAVVTPVPVVPVQVQTVPVAEPVQVQRVESEEIEKPSMREELKAALSDIQAEDDSRNYLAPKTYVSATLGLADYPSIDDIKGQYAMGFSVGTKFKDRIVVEGSFLYSRFQVERFYAQAYSPYGYSPNSYSTKTIDMDQYTGSVAVKAQLFSGMLRPVVGGLLSYSYAQYHEDSYYVDDSATHAIDAGVLAGADFDVDEEFSIGFDYRYLFNISNRTENNNRISLAGYNDKQIESQNHYILSLIGKMSF